MTLVDVRNQKTIQKTDRANTNYYFYKKVNLRMGRKRKITLVFKKKSESMQDIRSFYDYVSNIKGVTNLIGILASSDRTYKLTGNLIAQNIGGVWHHYMQLDNPTLYASPYLVATKYGYTKHYYAENERLLCKIGDGTIDGIDLHVVDTATLARKQTAVNQTAPNDQYTSLLSNLATLDGTQGKHPELYWQHSDHLGSASWITDTVGRTIQHLQYMPWGEPLLDYRNPSTSYSARYTFSGKERDEESGFSYFGARYYNSAYSIWLSVDPMCDKYPSLSPYVYCGNNPVKCVDPSGEEIYEFDENGQYLGVSGEKGSVDQIVIKKADGSTSSSKEYSHGTIISCTAYDKDNPYTDRYQNAFMLDIENEDAALDLLSFVADNGNVEWQVASGEDEQNNCSVVLGTLMVVGHVDSKTYLTKSKGCTNLSLVAHNHPGDDFMSTLVSEADVTNAGRRPETTFILYTKLLGFQRYDKNGNQNGQYIAKNGKIVNTNKQ